MIDRRQPFRRWRVRLALGLCVVGSGVPDVSAHDARPLSVSLFEQGGDVYRIRMHVPPSVERINEPHLVWPSGCDVPEVDMAGPLPVRGAPAEFSALLSCDGPIEGRTIGIDYPLFNPSISTVVRFVPIEGAPGTAVLAPEVGEWTVPRAPTRLEVAGDYGSMGVRHIWQGADHLLFVLGLLLLAQSRRRIFLVITGFTVAHSITLSLSALGWIDLAVEPTEAAIALSILFLAGELARPGPERLASRYPLLVSSSFGLLHGLGFAAALGEIGLPPGEIVTSLLFFNLGVEVGQILFILPLVIVIGLSNRVLDASPWFLTQSLRLRPRVVVSYGLGAASAVWLLQRLAAFAP